MIKFNDVFTFEHLVSAYFHCRKGKSFRKATVIYHMSYIANVYALHRRLIEDKYEIGSLYSFTIYEPKKRFVTANRFEDKIVQRVICKYVLEPLIGPKLIYDNYASQPFKGTHKGLERLQKHMRAYAKQSNWTGDGWVMMGDISKFFYTVDKRVCYNLIDVLPIDDALKKLIYDQIFIFDAQYNEYSDDPNRGICIGFQTSQWLAIYYLNGLDHYIKEKLHIKYYGRYMDDFYLIHEDRKYLEQCMKLIEKYVTERLGLKMNPKSHMHSFKQGICFLGYHCTYNQNTHQVETMIRNKSIRRLKKRTAKQKKLINAGTMTPIQARYSLESWHSYATHGETDRSKNAYRAALEMIDPFGYENELYEYELEDDRKIDPDGFYLLRYKNGFVAYPIPDKLSKRDACDKTKLQKSNLDLLLDIDQSKRMKKKKKRDPDLSYIIEDLDIVSKKPTKSKHPRDKDGFIVLIRKKSS